MKKFLLTALYILLIATGCSRNDNTPLSKTEFLMGTVCRIDLYDNKNKEILNKVFNRIKELDRLLSANSEDSEISLINQNAGREKVAVSEDVYKVIKSGLEFSDMSGGSFDITIGSLTSLWRIGQPDARVPHDYEIAEALDLINYMDVEADKNTVYLKKSGMKIDLGGIAKGYIADETAIILRENGVSSAIIDLGGNVLALGALGNEDWSLGVRAPDGGIVGIIRCTDKALVTSGIYERYTVADGIRYHHILNPENGYPFNSEVTSVTIMCEDSAAADALSTIAFMKGLESGMTFIEEMANTEALFITSENRIYLTSGLKNVFTLTNSKYIVN